MLPKMLSANEYNVGAICDEDGDYRGRVDSSAFALELARRWNAFEAMGEAVGKFLNEAGHKNLNAHVQPLWDAYALYLRPDNNADTRGQNINETA